MRWERMFYLAGFLVVYVDDHTFVCTIVLESCHNRSLMTKTIEQIQINIHNTSFYSFANIQFKYDSSLFQVCFVPIKSIDKSFMLHIYTHIYLECDTPLSYLCSHLLTIFVINILWLNICSRLSILHSSLYNNYSL